MFAIYDGLRGEIWFAPSSPGQPLTHLTFSTREQAEQFRREHLVFISRCGYSLLPKQCQVIELHFHGTRCPDECDCTSSADEHDTTYEDIK